MLVIVASHRMTSKISQLHNDGIYLSQDGFLLNNATKLPISSVSFGSFIDHNH